MSEKPKRGFANLTPERHKELASMGGKASHASGKGHQFTPEEGVNAGRKGGLASARLRKEKVALATQPTQPSPTNTEPTKE